MLYSNELAVARKAAEKAGTYQVKSQSKLTGFELKDGNEPVTEVDRVSEDIIRELIEKEYPDDGFLGEECGEKSGSSGRRWIVDPIDGTRPYIRGIPTYSVLIALEDNSKPVVGVAHLPAMGETYWASSGAGSFCNGEKLSVSSLTKMDEGMFSALGFVEESDTREGKNLFRLMKSWGYVYGFMDVYSHCSVAAGRIDACVNLLDKPWDCAAAACIVTEAGGRYSDIHGNKTIHNGNIVLSNGSLHDAILTFFA